MPLFSWVTVLRRSAFEVPKNVIKKITISGFRFPTFSAFDSWCLKILSLFVLANIRSRMFMICSSNGVPGLYCVSLRLCSPSCTPSCKLCWGFTLQEAAWLQACQETSPIRTNNWIWSLQSLNRGFKNKNILLLSWKRFGLCGSTWSASMMGQVSMVVGTNLKSVLALKRPFMIPSSPRTSRPCSRLTLEISG